MQIEATIKKWGNSYGILLSKKEMMKMNIEENDKIDIEVKPKNPLREIFGTFKTNKPTRELLKEEREGELRKDELLLRQLRNR